MIRVGWFSSFAQLRRDAELLHGGVEALLLKGVPVRDDDRNKKILSAAGAVLGRPRRYPQSIYGASTIHHLSEPSPASLARTGLDWHTEDSFAPLPPSFVVLLCLKGDTRVATHLCTLKGPSVDEHVTALVRPDPYLNGSCSPESRPVAFASGHAVGWRYDPALISATSDGPTDGITREREEQVFLETGDLLAFNNHALAHSRSAEPGTSGRHVLRMILGE